MESNDFKIFVDSISAAAAKEINNPRAIMFAQFLQDLYSGYHKYYPEVALKEGLVLIENDKAFKKPVGITLENTPQTPEEFQTRFKFLCWDSIILKRFQMFAFAKSLCENISKNAPPKNKEKNAIQEYVHFISAIMDLVKAGVENFKSFTINSIDQKNAKHLTVPNINLLVEKFNEDIKNFEKIKNTLPGNEDVKAKLIELISSFDIKEYQKHIFNGILEDFEISKKGTSGNQSIRYKTDLLWNLFKHSHPNLYHNTGTAGADVRSMRRNVLLSIISTDFELPIKF